jgi:hypothetical protein
MARVHTTWANKMSITFQKLSTAHKSKFPKPFSSKFNHNKVFLQFKRWHRHGGKVQSLTLAIARALGRS